MPAFRIAWTLFSKPLGFCNLKAPIQFSELPLQTDTTALNAKMEWKDRFLGILECDPISTFKNGVGQ